MADKKKSDKSVIDTVKDKVKKEFSSKVRKGEAPGAVRG